MTTLVPALEETSVPGWRLRSLPDSSRPARWTTRVYAASPVEGAAEIEFSLHSVPEHPLRACYPYGAHDLAVSIAASAGGEGLAARLLRDLVRALFTAEPRCRRVIAAPEEDDTATQLLLVEGGFLRVTEADLPCRTVVLYAVEPPRLAGLSTALDDMPH
ncbi:GNAT family N-acetyltransferase [Streptomyces griseorubiginosus]|uniref:GNAT family N-acetyltransferase n=1 Tax=Streptomyces griseorubiginosus TaxID=67304 RepID=UPI001AD6D7EA|nr:GNAT family N-acetyltransferase [Streptomyces griseorubiginosus]MBO4256353.1 GNAT family N-acetyltransferase [Streptomyces griseorubiginosus]